MHEAIVLVVKLSTISAIPIMTSTHKHIPGLSEFYNAVHLKTSFFLSASLTSVQAFLDMYVFSHSQWVQAIIFAVFADTITGVWKSVKKSVFSSYKFGAVFTKAVIYALVLVVIGGMNRIENDIIQAVSQFSYAAILIREVLSLIENIEAIRPNTFPKWLIKRFKDFDDNGQYQEK